MAADERLLARARELLSAAPLGEQELVARLYGVAGPATPWLPLLRRLLQGREGYERSADGTWRCEPVPAREPLLLSGRMTRARGGRLLALACSPVSQPDSTWRWHFAHDERAAGYVRRSAGVDEDTERGAIPFAEGAAEIAELLADRPILVLDARLPGVLGDEFAALGLRSPVGEVRALAASVWTERNRKRSIAEVRASLGLNPHVADELGGELEMLRRVGAEGAPEAPAAAAERPCGELDRSGGAPPRAVENDLRTLVETFPASPGVYVFRDAERRALYVGSAVNLRRRVLSYFTDQIELTRSLRGLLSRTAHVEHVPLGTHLEALLEEAELIRALDPVYNVQRGLDTKAAWLRIAPEPGGCVVQVGAASRGDRALYVGPLPSREAATAAASVMSELWGLRRRGGSPKVDPESVAVLDALRAVLADEDGFRAELRSRLRRVAPSLSAAKRRRLEAHVARTEKAALHGELQPIRRGARDALVASYDDATGDVSLLLVREGHCLAGARVPGVDRSAVGRTVADLAAIPPAPSGPASAEEATITSRWLHTHREDPFVFPLLLDPADLADALLSAVESLAEERRSASLLREDAWWGAVEEW